MILQAPKSKFLQIMGNKTEIVNRFTPANPLCEFERKPNFFFSVECLMIYKLKKIYFRDKQAYK